VHRDFTLNALYFCPSSRQVLDFVGGVDDARTRTLRLTADSRARLTEDPLRIMRGVRFSAVLGLKLAPDTALALRSHAHLCSMAAGASVRACVCVCVCVCWLGRWRRRMLLIRTRAHTHAHNCAAASVAALQHHQACPRAASGWSCASWQQQRCASLAAGRRP
jgi:hypothetical protein